MSNTIGPKGPVKGTKLEVKLEKPDAKPEVKLEGKVEGKPADAKADQPDAFGGRTAKAEGFLPDAEGDKKPTGAVVRARLQAMGGLIKTAARDRVQLKDTPIGRILEGSIVVESSKGLQQLDGVVRVTGDLTLQESVLKSPDLLVLKSLVEVGGRVTVEGNGALGLLDALESLERARGLYVGFNAALSRVQLPKLKELEAALIIEANPRLEEIVLPSLLKGGMYLHVHDNASLKVVLLPNLRELNKELSLVDNPRLITVKVASSDKPLVAGGGVELLRNAAHSYPLLFC